MVNRQVWMAREEMGPLSREQIDKSIRRRTGENFLPQGLPVPAWKVDKGSLVEISNEQFPGATPIWLWQG